MCHTAINALGGSSESQAFEGGLIPMQNWYAPSLTSNKEAGLGDWSIKDITDLLKTGVSMRGVVYGPMAEVVYDSLQYLSDDDIRAMAIYLKSLGSGRRTGARRLRDPKLENSLLLALGKTIYDTRCASCHGANGIGKPPHNPPLAGNQSIQMASAVNPIRMVLNGGFPPGTDGQSNALWHATLRAVSFRRRGRSRRHLYPHRLGQSRRGRQLQSGQHSSICTALLRSPC